MTGHGLPSWRSVLAVVAHPDDESFGLGGVLAAFADTAADVAVLCFTHGEASTLHGVSGELRDLRAAELRAAARILQVKTVTLLDYSDGDLAAFDPSGVTGHPDHQAATAAASAAAIALGLPLLAWTLPAAIAQRLNAEFAATFSGHSSAAIDIEVAVDRARQRLAIDCHPSQAVPASVLWRRLDLQGHVEHLRWIHREPSTGG